MLNHMRLATGVDHHSLLFLAPWKEQATGRFTRPPYFAGALMTSDDFPYQWVGLG